MFQTMTQHPLLNRLPLALICATLFQFSATADAADGATAAPPAATPDETVLADFKPHQLTRLDFDAAMLRIPEGDRMEFRRQMKRISNMLEETLVSRVLATEARSEGLDKIPLIKRRMELAIESVLADARVDAFRMALVVPDLEATARDYYRSNPDKFKRPARAHAAHVLVDATKRSDAEALERANQVRDKLVAGGDFSALAQEYSDDPSAQRNKGDLGFFTAGRMVKEFETAAFTMKVGEISAPVKTRFGYHVIKLLEREEERMRSFEEVRDVLINRFRQEFIDRATAEYIGKIKSDKAIKLNKPAIDALQTHLPPVSN